MNLRQFAGPVIAAATVVLSAQALAQAPGGIGRFIIRQMDTNGDFQVSQEEFVEFRRSRASIRFAQGDTDHDGALSREEFATLQADQARMRFRRMDKNGDGQWSVDEITLPGNQGGGEGRMVPPPPAEGANGN